MAVKFLMTIQIIYIGKIKVVTSDEIDILTYLETKYNKKKIEHTSCWYRQFFLASKLKNFNENNWYYDFTK